MPEFRLARPTTCDEAVSLLAAQPEARLVAGGTDLVPNLRRGLATPALLIDLRAVKGLDTIESGPQGLVLGAGVTLAQLACDERFAGRYAALGEAARAAAGPGHRSVATLGGNLCQDTRCVFYNQSEWWRRSNGWCLKRGGDTCHVAPQGARCHAAFSGDIAPALIALDAEVELVSRQGVRRVPLAECYRDDGAAHLAIGRDDIVTRIVVPAPAPGWASAYRKARVRAAMDFPLAGVACALGMRHGLVEGLRIAVTGTNSHPLKLEGTDAFAGQPLDETALAAIGKLVQKQVSPMRTTVTTANYRRQVAAVMAHRLVRELAAAG